MRRVLEQRSLARFSQRLRNSAYDSNERARLTANEFANSGRKGLNQRPLSTTAQSTDISSQYKSPLIHHESNDWRDWFSATEYANPWDAEESGLHTLEHVPLDVETRHIVQLLHELYLFGQPTTNNRVTTERCNHTLKHMFSIPIEDRADRADAILKRMELFDNLKPPSQCGRWPLEVPRPNRETYNLVLQIFAKTSGTRELAERAEAIVQKMEWRYRTLGELDMKPHAFHWNCVMLTYKECTDWDKSLYAAKLVLERLRHDPTVFDPSLFVNLLRVFAHRHVNEKAALLGANLAIKVWQDMIEDNSFELPELPSHFYGHFLQAIRCLPEENQFRAQYFDACFLRACQEGKINRIVLDEFLTHVRSRKVSDKHIGIYTRKTFALSKTDAVDAILEMMPDSWKANAEVPSG
jgi:hypothetical protein